MLTPANCGEYSGQKGFISARISHGIKNNSFLVGCILWGNALAKDGVVPLGATPSAILNIGILGKVTARNWYIETRLCPTQILQIEMLARQCNPPMCIRPLNALIASSELVR